MESKILNYIRSNPKATYMDLVGEFGPVLKELRRLENAGYITKISPDCGVEYYQINKYYERQ